MARENSQQPFPMSASKKKGFPLPAVLIALVIAAGCAIWFFWPPEGKEAPEEQTPVPEVSRETAEPEGEAPELGMVFDPVQERVTAKEETNLRSLPSQGEESDVIYQLKNGEVALRTGISDSGWSTLLWKGKTVYAVSSYLTTDLTQKPKETTAPDDGIETEFREVNQQVTAKDVVNLRTLPSVTHPDSKVDCRLNNGDVAVCTGVSDSGWSRLTYNGKTLYAISSYLTGDLSYKPNEETRDPDGIETEFAPVSEEVTAKDVVNLRTLPSVTNPESKVEVQLHKGQVAVRTGINTDVGWSRVEYEGKVLYCISSYLMSPGELPEETPEASQPEETTTGTEDTTAAAE